MKERIRCKKDYRNFKEGNLYDRDNDGGNSCFVGSIHELQPIESDGKKNSWGKRFWFFG